jgi:hypothetical protein
MGKTIRGQNKKQKRQLKQGRKNRQLKRSLGYEEPKKKDSKEEDDYK